MLTSVKGDPFIQCKCRCPVNGNKLVKTALKENEMMNIHCAIYYKKAQVMLVMATQKSVQKATFDIEVCSLVLVRGDKERTVS